MGFIDSLLTWLLLILVIAFILFTVFSYILGWFYPTPEEVKEEILEPVEETDYQEQAKRRRKIIGIIFVVTVSIIMATTGVNAFLNTKS